MSKTTQLINGKAIAAEILSDLKVQISKMSTPPGLAAILVGDNPASKLYIQNKEKAGHQVGINFHKYLCCQDCYQDITEPELLKMINFLNSDPEIHGILVQLPMPNKFDTQKIITAIDPKKDADGFHPQNLNKYLRGQSPEAPVLVKTILTILKHEKIEVKNKKIVVITHSKIFGPAIVKALKDLGASVYPIPETASNLKTKTQQADILISVAGQPEFIKEDFIKEDAVIIDVGITLTDDGFRGDVDINSIKKKASMVTPTPGGVGPVTVAMLLKNVYQLAKNQ